MLRQLKANPSILSVHGTLGPDYLAVQEDNWSTWNVSRAEQLSRRVIENRLVLKGERKCASVDLRKRIRVHELEESWSRIGSQDVYLVASTLIEPGLRAQPAKADAGGDEYFLVTNGEKGTAHLDPAPDDGKECGCVNDGDCVERFWIVGGGKFRGVLEVAAKRPHETKGDTAEVDDRSGCHDRR
jgi:hypothetical protein